MKEVLIKKAEELSIVPKDEFFIAVD